MNWEKMKKDMSNKKSVIINNVRYYYIIKYDCSEFGEYYWTEFYQETYTETYKKYWLFGPVLTKEVPIILFEVGFNIENIYYTKSEVREKIQKEIELLNREEEIERGEIV